MCGNYYILGCKSNIDHCLRYIQLSIIYNNYYSLYNSQSLHLLRYCCYKEYIRGQILYNCLQHYLYVNTKLLNEIIILPVQLLHI